MKYLGFGHFLLNSKNNINDIHYIFNFNIINKCFSKHSIDGLEILILTI